MASIHASNEAEVDDPISVRRLVQYGFFALVAVCLVNVLVLFVGLAVATFPAEFVGGPFGPLAVGPVVANSAIAAVGATLAYGVITHYASRPNRMFVIVAGVVLLLSFAMFLSPDIAGAPLAVYAFLGVMHVSAAVVIVGILIRAASPEGASR